MDWHREPPQAQEPVGGDQCSSFKIMLPMILSMRQRLLTPLLLVIALGLTAAAALADSVATTEPATSVAMSSAVLNGVANPTNPNSAYTFQYGTSASYGQTTPAHAIGTGSQNVSASVTGLQPGTTYHFRLLVVEGSYPAQPHYGADLTFTTTGTANAVATTGNATSITTNSAVLNGVVNVSNPNSAWLFQYGTTTAYGKLTKAQPVGAGVTAVSATVTGLTKGKVYHFRLAVFQGSYPTQISYGADRTFTPRLYGTLSLRKRHLKVTGHTLKIPLKCTGGKGAICAGKISITARSHGKTIRCAGVRFSIKRGRHGVRKTVRGKCLALLGAAAGHRHRARFTATLTSSQAPLKRRVVLFK